MQSNIKINKFLFNLLLLIIFIDFSTDPVTKIYSFDITFLDPFVKLTTIILFIFLFIYNLNSFPRNIYFLIPFFIILFTISYGFIRGIFSNRLIDTFNDTSSYLGIILFPTIINFSNYDPFNELKIYIKFIIIILFFKLLSYELLSIFLNNSLSWKILLKQSPILLIPYSILVSFYLKKIDFPNKYLYLLVAVFILFIAMARMIFLSMIFITLIQFIRLGYKSGIIKILSILIILSLAFVIYLFIQQVDQLSILDHLYGGEVYEGGVDYRLEQLKIILIRFQHFPFLGVGFGYFTPGYLTYEFLPKPYLLELDLLNFISKIGFLFFMIYILSYLFIYKLINRINDKIKKETYLSFFIGLLSLLLYSIGQTLHQSYLYWVSFSILYSCIIIEIRKQNIKSL
jgi:hypothetical protein